jgi:hypothetical protein
MAAAGALAVLCLGTWAAFAQLTSPTQTENQAASTTMLLAPFVGIWSNTQEGCKKLK